MLFDSHCHLDSPRFDSDREDVLARAREVGVEELLIPAVGPQTWEQLLDGYGHLPGVHVALGIHPQLLPELDASEDDRHLADLERLLARGGAVAIGECGLDGPTAATTPFDRQCAVLAAHFALARRFDLPVLVHCLRAHDPLLELLEREGPVRLILHSFSGSAEQARLYHRFDPYFSFAGPLTYPNARRPLAAARAVPRDRLLVETDAPDQAPRPHTGRCEPSLLPLVVGGLARALELPEREVGELTHKNARTALRLDGPSGRQ